MSDCIVLSFSQGLFSLTLNERFSINGGYLGEWTVWKCDGHLSLCKGGQQPNLLGSVTLLSPSSRYPGMDVRKEKRPVGGVYHSISSGKQYKVKWFVALSNICYIT